MNQLQFQFKNEQRQQRHNILHAVAGVKAGARLRIAINAIEMKWVHIRRIVDEKRKEAIKII